MTGKTRAVAFRARTKAAAAGAPSREPSLQGNQREILVVERDSDFRSLVVSSLADLDFGPIETDTPAAAMALCIRHPDIALVVTDIEFPGSQSGIDLLNQVRRSNRCPVLLMTGLHEKAEIASYLGDDEKLLMKPFRHLELVASVRHLFSERWRPNGRPAAAAPLP